MKMRFTVSYLDGRKVDVSTAPKDIVAFERQYSVPFVAFGDDATPMEWLYYLAWSPLHRSKQEPRGFDEFLDDLDDVRSLSAVTPDPTQPAASGDSSPA